MFPPSGHRCGAWSLALDSGLAWNLGGALFDGLGDPEAGEAAGLVGRNPRGAVAAADACPFEAPQRRISELSGEIDELAATIQELEKRLQQVAEGSSQQ
ncbi:MAG: hypothetical protein IIC59_10035 [Proteobacteria bacterium]|nr:hypothetical protein [Pseudomonadota bacterium]